MEGNHTHWNPGIGPGPSVAVVPPPPETQVWPQMQPECLMGTTDPSMFGYPLVLSSDGHASHPHRLTEFRHRFSHTHPPSIHFTTIANSVLSIGGHGGHHHDNLDLNIPSHPLVDVPESESNNTSVQAQVQDAQLGGMESRHHEDDGLEECSEDCSDEDEEEDSEEEEMHMEGYVHSLSHNPSMTHNSLVVEDNSLPSCQQHSHQLRAINSNNEVGMLGNGLEDASCHQKSGMMSHVHEIQEEIPPINQGHPLNSNPISAIPMITGSCSSMMMSDEQEVVRNVPSQSQNSSSMMNSDPSSAICSNNGQSVHGKLYVEERVVFHLKQWTDSGFGNFNSCREQEQQKNQLYHCAVCQLQSHHNGLQQKDTHRHPVRGVLVSFEDCIILELYPEDYMNETRADCRPNDSLDPKHSMHVGGNKEDHLSYFNSSAANIPMTVEPNASQSLEKSSVLNQDHNRGWWEYESERQVEEGQLVQHTNDTCAINLNLKLSAQRYHDAQTEAEAVDIRIIHQEGLNEPADLETQEQGAMMQSNQEMNQTQSPEEFQKYDDRGEKYDENSVCYSSAEVQEVQPLNVKAASVEDTRDDDNSSQSQSPTLSPEDNCKETAAPKSVDPFELSSNEDKGKRVRITKTKGNTKYPCPSCSKFFSLKRLLKDHLEEKHESGNPFQCNLCKTQYADSQRLLKHSCTLSVESIKNRLKIKEVKEAIEQKQNFNSDSDSGNYLEDQQQQHQTAEKEKVFASSSNELIIIPKSSKIRKFSDKARIKLSLTLQKQDPLEEDTVSINLEAPDEESQTQNFRQSTEKSKAKYENTENEIEKIMQHPRFVKSSCTSPIKVNQDENLDKNVHHKQGKQGKTKEFGCKACGKYFSTALRLKNHTACHGPEHGSQCDQCGKRFARRDKLMRHMYVHSEEKLFVCDICEKRFSRRDKLRDHLKSHQTDEIHNCPMCEKQFLRPDILKQHVKMHQMGDKHQCPECLRFVTGKDRLAQHMKRHEESKALGQTLVCPLCTKYFIQQQSLKAHIRKFHPDALQQLNLNHFMELSTNAASSRNTKLAQENIAETCSGSPSSSNSSQDPKSPSGSTHRETCNDEDKNTTTVCKVLKNVMSSSKLKHKSSPSTNSTEVSKNSKQFPCTVCPATFSRKQVLKNHEISEHSKPAAQSSLDNNANTSEEIRESDRILKRAGKPVSTTSSPSASKSERNIKTSKGQHFSKDKKKSSTREISSSNATTTSTTKSSPPNPTSSPLISIPSTLSSAISQQQKLLKLPSCASLTSDLSFMNPHASSYQHPQLHHISAYSQHLALSMVGAGRGISVQNIHQLQNSGLMSSESVVNGHFINGSISHSQSPSPLICPPNTSYVINYPTTTGMPYSDQ